MRPFALSRLSAIATPTVSACRRSGRRANTCQAGFGPLRRMEHYSNSVNYNYVEHAEDLFAYQPGGYHPIAIGDQLHQRRYHVVHKLGHGAYSTVWLARDYQSSQLVAIKVGLGGSSLGEVATLLALKGDSKQGHPNGIPEVLDQFEISGPNGVHPCCVMRPAMCSLNAAKDAGTERLFPIDVARALTTQLLKAVAWVHKHGFVHGDIHPGNVLLQLPESFMHLSDQELYAQYGEPVLEPVTRIDGHCGPLPHGVPSHVVLPLWLAKASEQLTVDDAKLLLSDFGEAFAPSQGKRLYSNTPLGGRPPECRFEPEQPVSFPADIWMLACTIWQICGMKPLFDSVLATEDSITRQQVEALGMLPAPWWERWVTRNQFYDKDGTPKAAYPRRALSARLEQHFVNPRKQIGMPCFDHDEKAGLEDILRRMLSFSPRDRPTIEQILATDWAKRWISECDSLG